MIKFIDQVSSKILYETPIDQLHQVNLVLPSNRSINLIKQSLIRKINGSCILPEMTTIKEFVVSLSKLNIISNLDSLLILMKVLEKLDKEDQFNTNIYDLKQLLNDINSIDNYVVSKKEFFHDLLSFGNIENWDFDVNKNLKEKNYFSRLRLIENIYNEFNYTLIKNSQGTYSSICDQIACSEKKIFSKIGKTYFIGLNALSVKEEIIINFICENNIGSKVLVDTQEFFVQNHDHEAGHFYRKQSNKFYNNPNRDLFEKKKKINTYEVDYLQNQIYVIDQILKNDNENIAIVNMNEQFSPSIFNGLSKNHEINFSSGFPLEHFESYKIFKFFCDSILTHNSKFNFNYDWISELISFKLISKENQLSYQKKLETITEFELSMEKLKLFFPALGQLIEAYYSFKKSKKEQNTNKLELLLNEIQKYVVNNAFENDVISIILKELNLLNIKTAKFQVDLTLKEKLFILNDQLSKKRISVIGNPASRVQLIGLLETRMLDSETIIFTNFNEEFIPGKKMQETNIPKELKRKYKLPSNYEKDALYAYYFYRAIHYPKNIHLIYLSSKSSGIKSNEPSRYLYQIKSEIGSEKNVSFSMYQSTQKDMPLLDHPKKNDKDILKLLNWMKSGISTSAINTYLNCSLDFYFKYVLDVRENQKPNEFLKSNEWGTAIHNTLEQLFLTHKQIDHVSIKKMKSELSDCLQVEFNKLFPDYRYLKGKNKINYYQAEQYILNYLEKEISNLNFSGYYQILDTEKELSISKKIHLAGEFIECCFKGKIDRIDSTAKGIRLIDYKTGYVTKSDLSISNMDSIKSKHKALQLLFYCMLFLGNHDNHDEVYANIIALSNTNSPILELNYKRNSQFNNTHIQDFFDVVQLILQEIKDPNVKLFHNDASKFCSFC